MGPPLLALLDSLVDGTAFDRRMLSPAGPPPGAVVIRASDLLDRRIEAAAALSAHLKIILVAPTTAAERDAVENLNFVRCAFAIMHCMIFF